jgi:tRNA(Arg) A34 adenosine deaminase TadA
MENPDKKMMERAVALALQNMQSGEGGPFGAVVVKDGKIIAEGNNRVLADNDPTAHAEVVAIRRACAALGSFQLTDCEIYSSCEPCPMCLGAIYWARPARLYYACTRHDAAEIGFDDAFIYHEIALPLDQRQIPFVACPHHGALDAFRQWQEKGNKTLY